MTTIAICERYVAADGRQCMGTEIIRDDAKKIRVHGNVIYITAGDAAAADAAIQWYRDGAKPGSQPVVSKDEVWRLIVVTARGDRPVVTMYCNDGPYGFDLPLPQAIGSGSSYALAALDLGHSARTAVECAARRDVFTGGDIQVVDIRSVLFGERAATRDSAREIVEAVDA